MSTLTVCHKHCVICRLCCTRGLQKCLLQPITGLLDSVEFLGQSQGIGWYCMVWSGIELYCASGLPRSAASHFQDYKYLKFWIIRNGELHTWPHQYTVNSAYTKQMWNGVRNGGSAVLTCNTSRLWLDCFNVWFCVFPQNLNMDVEDKSVEVDFEWVKNLVSDGKIREHGLATERSTSPKFLLLDVRRLVFFTPLNAGIFYVT